MTDSDIVLDLRRARVRFGSATVLRDVDFQVRRGEVVGLLGQNGSGKSTMVKLLAGVNKPDGDTTLRVGGTDVPLPLQPATAHHLNMAFVHQDLGLAKKLTVAENLMIAGIDGSRGFIPWPAEHRRLRAVLDEYGVNVDPAATVDELPPVEQALVAIVRAAEEIKKRHAVDGADHAIIFLDEPTVFLPKEETAFLYDLVRRLSSEGASTVFISHDLAAVRELCDRVFVLRDGEHAGEARVSDIDDDELIELIVGRNVEESTRAARAVPSDAHPVLRAENLRGGQLESVSFSVAPGEILGVAGLAGSGADDVPYALFGAAPQVRGTVSAGDRRVECERLTPARAVAAGIGLVPADRRRDAIAAEMTVGENALMLTADTFVTRGAMSWRRFHRRADELLETFDVRPRRADREIGLLSGGNQQKVVLAKWLEIGPSVLVLHEPTQGVDVAARAQIRDDVRQATTGGMGVVWVTTDFEELALLSDRVLVLANGHVAAELAGAEISEDAINTAVYRSSIGGAALATDDHPTERNDA